MWKKQYQIVPKIKIDFYRTELLIKNSRGDRTHQNDNCCRTKDCRCLCFQISEDWNCYSLVVHRFRYVNPLYENYLSVPPTVKISTRLHTLKVRVHNYSVMEFGNPFWDSMVRYQFIANIAINVRSLLGTRVVAWPRCRAPSRPQTRWSEWGTASPPISGAPLCFGYGTTSTVKQDDRQLEL